MGAKILYKENYFIRILSNKDFHWLTRSAVTTISTTITTRYHLLSDSCLPRKGPGVKNFPQTLWPYKN